MSIPCAKETFAGSLLVGLCILAYLPGFLALPPVDRDEPRFAQTSRQMLEAESWGAYLAPRIQDRPRVNKPLLTYWLQAGTAGIFAALHPDAAWADSTTTSAAAAIWPYRVPSLLAAVVAVLATAQLGRSMFGSAGYVAAALVATTPLVAWEARQARADELLLAFTLLAQLALWSIWSERRVATHSLRTAVLLWVAIGLGVMTKGPVTPAVVTATVVCQSLAFQEWRWLGRLHVGLGLCIVALLVAPWTLLLAEQVGWMVYLHSLYDEIVGRSLLPKEGHWGPPGYHLALLAVLFWPGWLFLRPAFAALATWVRRLFTMQTDRRMPLTEAEAFCLAWIVPCWVAFELVQTKLPHYPMPLYPGLALLVAHGLSTSASAQARAGRHLTAARVLWLAVGSVLVVGTPVAAWAVGGMMRDTWLTLLTLAATLTGGTLLFVAARALQQQRSGRAILAGVLALASAETLVCTLLPHAQALWLAPRVVGLVDAVDPQHRRPLAAVEFHEDSLVFLTAGRVERIVAADLPAWLRSHPGGLAIVPHQANHTLRGLHTLGEAEGFNYSKGRWLRLRLIEQAQARRDGAPHRRAPEPS